MFTPNYEQMFPFPTCFWKQWELPHLTLTIPKDCPFALSWLRRSHFVRQCKLTHNLPVLLLVFCCCRHRVCGLWRECLSRAGHNLTCISTLPEEVRPWPSDWPGFLFGNPALPGSHKPSVETLGWYTVRHRSQTSQNRDHFQISSAHFVGSDMLVGWAYK